MKKFEQTFVFTGTAQEFKADPLGADRSNHGGYFDRHLLLLEEQLKIKNIVDLHHCLAFDNASTHGNVSYHTGSASSAAGKRQSEAYRDALMFAAIEKML